MPFPGNKYMFKVNNRNTRKRYKICTFSSAFIVDFKQVKKRSLLACVAGCTIKMDKTDKLSELKVTVKLIAIRVLLCISLEAPISQNGQTHSNNSSATADNSFECV